MKTRCDICGTKMYKFEDKHYCPNCDTPPNTELNEDEEPKYVG